MTHEGSIGRTGYESLPGPLPPLRELRDGGVRDGGVREWHDEKGWGRHRLPGDPRRLLEALLGDRVDWIPPAEFRSVCGVHYRASNKTVTPTGRV